MGVPGSEPIVVLITATDKDQAEGLANALVDAGLASCVQIMPEIRSVYKWEGSVQKAAEVLILAKTLREKFADLERRVRTAHSYEVPEILAIPVCAISQPYLKWLTEALPQRHEPELDPNSHKP